jgi:hypothetical protein
MAGQTNHMRRAAGLSKTPPPSLDDIMASASNLEETAVNLQFDNTTLLAMDWLACHVGQSREGLLTNLVIEKYLKILKSNGSGSK